MVTVEVTQFMIAQIPLEFQFQKVETHWTEVTAQIRGWWKRSDGTVDPENLAAMFKTNGIEKSVQLPLERLPDEQWMLCTAYLGNTGNEQMSDVEVEKACSGFEAQFLVRSDKTYNLKFPEPLGPSQTANAWEMRDEFLHLNPDCENTLGFLNKWGSWDFREYAFLSDISGFQRVVHDALTSSPEEWFAKDYSVAPAFRRRPKYPFFTLKTDKCELAIRLTVTFDHLRGAKFKICGRRECAHLFEVKNKHEKQFCSRKCGHSELVRRNRKRGGN